MNHNSESRAGRARLSGKCLVWTADNPNLSLDTIHNQVGGLTGRTDLRGAFAIPNEVRVAQAAPGRSPQHEYEQRPDAALIKSSGRFVQGFAPPDYLIDGLMQRRFCYSLTGQTGGGKTALSLLIAACVARGVPIGGREVAQGRVLFLAGENPDDIRMRWIAMAEALGFDVNKIDVHFVTGRFSISGQLDRVRKEVERLGGVALLIVDTSAAYFEGEDENHNVQAGAHARNCREFTKLPGGPTVLVNCHPVKNAGGENLVPRGGGAFLAEVDGNLTAAKNDTLVKLHWHGKFRGPEFAPLSFKLKYATAGRLKDSRGKSVFTVYARCLTDEEQRENATQSSADEAAVLILLQEADGEMTLPTIAKRLKWFGSNGKPYKMKVFRVVEKLEKQGLVNRAKGIPALTERGEREAKKAIYKSEAQEASYA